MNDLKHDIEPADYHVTVAVEGRVMRIEGDLEKFRAAAVGRVLARAHDGEPDAIRWLEAHGVKFWSLRGGE